MHTNYTKRAIELVAVAVDGTTYIIERRCDALPGDDDEYGHFYCCLPNGQIVSWLGENHYQLSDGTALLAIACRLAQSGPPS